eukprot:Skav225871  [mRNA]  locus=scaffold810:386506:387744:+ [translate_table: standard]
MVNGWSLLALLLAAQALTEVAMKRDLLPEEAVDRVCLAHGPDYESSTTAFEEAASAGPERFFYDKTTYTGDGSQPRGAGRGG